MTQDYIRQKALSLEVKLRSLVHSMRFSCVGVVSTVNAEGTRISVTLPYLDSNLKPIILQGIEVLRPGTHDVVVKFKPKIGDVAIVLSMQDYWSECKFQQQAVKPTVKAAPYSDVTMKAILVQTNEVNAKATTVEITDTELNIKTPLKTNVTVNNNEATVTCTKLTINNHLTVE